MHTDSELKGVLQVFVFNELCNMVHLFRVHLKEWSFEFVDIVTFPFLLVSSAQCNKIEGGQACLSTRGNENEHWIILRMCLDRLEGRLVHGSHAGTVVLLGEAFEVDLYWDGSD